MSNIETVSTSTQSIDPLIRKQKEGVAKMRASLLCCNDDIYSAAQAMKNITVLRVYHQMNRIIRYLEMMDKIEEKLYASIDVSLNVMDETEPSTWMALLTIQEKLQKNLVDSHKLLEPYINNDLFNIESLAPTVIEQAETNVAGVLTKESRETLRISAQNVLAALDTVKEGEADE